MLGFPLVVRRYNVLTSQAKSTLIILTGILVLVITALYRSYYQIISLNVAEVIKSCRMFFPICRMVFFLEAAKYTLHV